MKYQLVFGAALLTGALASAQERQQSELGQLQGELRQRRAEEQRLLDIRQRHDLGLPGEERDDRTFRAAPVNTETMERMLKQKEDEESAAMVLNAEYEKLRAAVDQLKAAAEERMRAEAADHPLGVVPQAGVAVPRTTQPGGNVPVQQSQAIDAGADRKPTEHGAPEPVLPAPLDPIVTQIHGSNDHQRVATALFRSGQDLMRVAATARAQGHAATAKELDDRGRDKLVRAIAELEPLLAVKEPPFAALFYLGRSRELLFRYSERHEQLSPSGSSRDYARREQEVREPFLAITARDVERTGPRSDVDLLGDWGRAAQTAMTNFSWTNQHAAYDAMPTIKALTWPGER